jgi:hypothetical protein
LLSLQPFLACRLLTQSSGARLTAISRKDGVFSGKTASNPERRRLFQKRASIPKRRRLSWKDGVYSQKTASILKKRPMFANNGSSLQI